MGSEDRTPGTTVRSSDIRRCHENVCQSLGNALIYPSVFVAAETCSNSPLFTNGRLALASVFQLLSVT
jgi:hypothetical protein